MKKKLTLLDLPLYSIFMISVVNSDHKENCILNNHHRIVYKCRQLASLQGFTGYFRCFWSQLCWLSALTTVYFSKISGHVKLYRKLFTRYNSWQILICMPLLLLIIWDERGAICISENFIFRWMMVTSSHGEVALSEVAPSLSNLTFQVCFYLHR